VHHLHHHLIHVIVPDKQEENVELLEHLLKLNAETLKLLHVKEDVQDHLHHQLLLTQIHVIVPETQEENVELQEHLLKLHVEIKKLHHANKDVHHQIHVIVMQKQLENADQQELLLKLNAEIPLEQIVFKDVQCHHLQEQSHKFQLFQVHVTALQQHLLNVDQELLLNL
jgi:hypothetical protein